MSVFLHFPPTSFFKKNNSINLFVFGFTGSSLLHMLSLVTVGRVYSLLWCSGFLVAPHSSILAWKIRWTEEPGRLQSMGSRRVRHD